MPTHYTAVLEVVEVATGGTVANPQKDKSEVARIVVRDVTLAGLRNKLAAHVALIEK